MITQRKNSPKIDANNNNCETQTKKHLESNNYYSSQDVDNCIDETFFKYLSAIALSALITSMGFWKIIGVPLFDESKSLCFVLPVLMTFVWVSHIRALWFVPIWVEKINIFFDLGTSFLSILFFPSIYGIGYVVIHGGFLMMFLFDNNRFRAIFKMRKSLGHYHPIAMEFLYISVNIMEMLYQLRFIYLHGSLLAVSVGLITFSIGDEIGRVFYQVKKSLQ